MFDHLLSTNPDSALVYLLNTSKKSYSPDTTEILVSSFLAVRGLLFLEAMTKLLDDSLLEVNYL